ncbi:TerD family protein [Tsukamurella pseudospumae]|uniref:TerD domain-containing protein n=1 Tax=Tsukamurella pseudospumae TaxID=239498 RepID=A0A138AIL8_9ACTN|nr:TerD family protein [Tsukamurella pseudospumae]KXP00066.1 hypothetical protein AXK61_15835 [Tsukamurella pseudospumae]KXP10326.1 hypothetical protein AXK60_07660 [Tsukamurella pseudospumae]
MSESHVLVKGANIKVGEVFGDPSAHVTVTIATRVGADVERIPTDVSVLILGGDGKVRSNDDLIFYNQPLGADAAVRLTSSVGSGEVTADEATIEVDLARLPESVDRVLIAASIDGSAGTERTFGEAESLCMTAESTDESSDSVVVSELTGLAGERAVIFGEIYRRESEWKIRAVGQGYSAGLRALVGEYGVDVDDPPADRDDDVAGGAADVIEEQEFVGDVPVVPGTKVALSRRRKAVAKLPVDWKERACPGLPVEVAAGPWRRARLFPAVGIRSSAEQEGRTTSVLLSVMSTVPEFGRRIASLMGAPRGRTETFTEVVFPLGGQEHRPDGLIRVSRGSKEWVALVEVKTAKGALNADQIDRYVQIARAKGFDAVVTITCDVPPCPGELPIQLKARPPKSVSVTHLSWEEIVTEGSLALAASGGDRLHDRIMEQFLLYASEQQAGMWQFGDMGRHWVKVRNGVADGTLSASDPATAEVCARFDQLTRHLALQLTALTGQTASSQIPSSRADAVSRAKQLADSGELFGTLRVDGATAPIVLNANLSRLKVGCSQAVQAPRAGRTTTKINWLLRQLDAAPPKLRVTAHHFGSRTETTSALMESARDDPAMLVPPSGRDIREFTITAEASMGSKRAASENGFVSSMVDLVNGFHRDVTEVLRAPRPDR